MRPAHVGASPPRAAHPGNASRHRITANHRESPHITALFWDKNLKLET
jgi:hypothetical protein